MAVVENELYSTDAKSLAPFCIHPRRVRAGVLYSIYPGAPPRPRGRGGGGAGLPWPPVPLELEREKQQILRIKILRIPPSDPDSGLSR